LPRTLRIHLLSPAEAVQRRGRPSGAQVAAWQSAPRQGKWMYTERDRERSPG